ncbi:RNA pseudouridine synthase [Alkalimonas collagenimarina]|uniref:RNA pseudouridine synthase n=1 Tax=Alkalimonas collagenimarina TaxID=400390 RepID=A0ABT9GYG6_9GAMM|nr:RNA pseudouridine synthase [Alkalimonas collagenimarina]MDP4536103.1 RNA pseudouridine synthase [Alkalimonas collagenimarina]
MSRRIQVTEANNAIECLATAVPELSKSRLKDAMSKGAVYLVKGKKQKRIRRAQTMLHPGQCLQLHYDEQIMQRSAPMAELLLDMRSYSVWWKPAGLLAQGSQWGDHLSLLRQVELTTGRPVFLVHRLDREASGLMMIAHQAKAAAALSQQFSGSEMTKHYVVQIAGQLPVALLQQGCIQTPLDGKPCHTRFQLLRYDESVKRSWLQVELLSGRKHQIRRHFSASGYPVMGDPQYGNAVSSSEGMALQAVLLGWQCPQSKQLKTLSLPDRFSIYSSDVSPYSSGP